MILKTVCTGLMICFLQGSLLAQKETAASVSDIEILKEGVLVIRLDMKKNAIEAYEDILSRSEPEDRQYKIVSERLEKLRQERQEYKDNIREALSMSYKFSEYCLLENHDAKALLDGESDVLECYGDNAIDLINEGNYFFLIQGDEETHWMVTDKEFSILPSPFPGNHNIGVVRVFDFLAGAKSYSVKNQTKVFEKMNKRFENFYANSRK